MRSLAMYPEQTTLRKCILIAGSPARGYLQMIAKGFRNCGVEPILLEWHYPKTNLIQDVIFALSPGYRQEITEARNRTYALALQEKLFHVVPDYLLTINPVDLTQETRDFCEQKHIKTSFWAYDNLDNWPNISRIALQYDIAFTYEPEDTVVLSKSGNARFLPLAYDPEYYHPTKCQTASPTKDIDISFIGSVNWNPKRKQLLKALACRFKHASIFVLSGPLHWYSVRRVIDRTMLGPWGNMTLVRTTVEPHDLCCIHERSKICLSIQNAQCIKALNPRNFEILASGGLLLTDRRLDELEGFADRDGYVYYSSERDLMEKVDHILKNYQQYSEMAKIGHSRMERHTWERRTARICNDLERLDIP